MTQGLVSPLLSSINGFLLENATLLLRSQQGKMIPGVSVTEFIFSLNYSWHNRHLRHGEVKWLVKSDSRCTKSIGIGSDGVVHDSAAAHQPCARENTIHVFSLNYSWHIWGIEGSSGWSSSQVRQYKCMHTESIDFSGFCCGSSILRQKIHHLCVFAPHLCVFFDELFLTANLWSERSIWWKKHHTFFVGLCMECWKIHSIFGRDNVFLENNSRFAYSCFLAGWIIILDIKCSWRRSKMGCVRKL